jgi:hypothetical protein
MGSNLNVEGVTVGATFESRYVLHPTDSNSRRISFVTFMICRAECADKGIHRKAFAGIVGTLSDGAQSICVSSTYEDDEDRGEFLYAFIPLRF